MTLLSHYYCHYNFYKSRTIIAHYDKIRGNTIISLMTNLLLPLLLFDTIMAIIAIMTLLWPLWSIEELMTLMTNRFFYCHYFNGELLFALLPLSQKQ